MKIYILTCSYSAWNTGDSSIHTEVFKDEVKAKAALKAAYDEDMDRDVAEIYDHEFTDNYYYVQVEETTEGAVEYRGEITEHEIFVTEYDMCYDKIKEAYEAAEDPVDEEYISELADELVNDDYAWEEFTNAFEEIAGK